MRRGGKERKGKEKKRGEGRRLEGKNGKGEEKKIRKLKEGNVRKISGERGTCGKNKQNPCKGRSHWWARGCLAGCLCPWPAVYVTCPAALIIVQNLRVSSNV